MLSLFSLSVLGAFGVSNTLGDASDRGEDEADWRDDEEQDAHEAFGGSLDDGTDLIGNLEAYAASGTVMTGGGAPGMALTPGAQASALPSETEADAAFEAAFSGLDAQADDRDGDAASAPLTGDVLTPGSAETEETDVEVIALSVPMPGLGAPDADPDATEAGFRTALAPGDELTLNIDPDLPGQLVAVHAVYDADPDEDRVSMSTAINFYLTADGATLPDGQITGSEAEFMQAFGLQKLGTVEMGRLAAHLDPQTGDVVITEDSRQSDLPTVIGNRDMAELSAVFR